MAITITTLSGCRNLREVAGQGTVGGRTVQRGLLYRSDSLHHLRPIDAELVRRTVLPRTLVDLRSPREVERDGLGPLADGVSYVHLPLVPFDDGGPLGAGRRPDMLELYLWIAESSRERLAALIRLLGAPEALPAIVFCTAGKDRTGIAVATVLASLGVHDAEIVEDYAASGSIADDRFPLELASRRWPPGVRDSRPETMDSFLRAMRRRHGSLRSFVASGGVRLHHLVRLERVLLGF